MAGFVKLNRDKFTSRVATFTEVSRDLEVLAEDAGVTVSEMPSCVQYVAPLYFTVASATEFTVNGASVGVAPTFVPRGGEVRWTAKYTYNPHGAGNVVYCAAGVVTADSANVGITPDYVPYVAATAVVVTPTAVSLVAGTTAQITATTTPSGATQPVFSYVSSDATKATVSATGLVTAVAAGTATITATDLFTGTEYECVVTVTAA